MEDKELLKYKEVPTPAYILEEAKLIQNLEKIQYVQEQAEVKIILALKAFALWKIFPTISKYLAGATASSLNEALLIANHFKTDPAAVVKAHTYSPAYIPAEMDALIERSCHITFNSLNQFHQYKAQCSGKVSCGLRVNPEWSSVETDLYNPSAKGSRLGEPIENIEKNGLPEEIEGLHVHVLCESNSYDLEKVLTVFEEKFGKYFGQIRWINLGGGHLMTHKDYDIEHLIKILKAFKKKYPHIELILEPGSAVVWGTGVLTSTVLDIVENNAIKTAILDVSFTCHMPDTLEMPYRPEIIGVKKQDEDSFAYRLGGISCLAGDFLELYKFDKELIVGDVVVFLDMMHYTTVKTSMFNGVQHPSVYVLDANDGLVELRSYDYQDYEKRMC